MSKKFTSSSLYVLIAVLSVNSVLAQSPENSINLYGLNYPQEKIHVHFDKDVYFPGETVWFKSYILEDNRPSYRSTNFYIALYDLNGKMIEQKISPIIDATSDGFFKLPDSIGSDQVICRAYTAWMLNFDSSNLFTRPLHILNTGDMSKQGNATTILRFFPEGGDIISGEKNTIAFKAVYTNGLPYTVEARIRKDGSDDVITTIRSTHNGMGRFDMDQVSGEVYYATWTDEKGTSRKTYLPSAKASGVSLKMAQQPGKLFYNIANRSANDTLHVLAYMYQKVIYKADIPLSHGARLTGMISLQPFPSGVLQFTVFDQQWQPLAERVSFIDNGNYLNAVSLNTEGFRLEKRAKNTIQIQLPDSIPANMSISVTDADINNGHSNNTIISNMLLNADVRGHIYNADQYFKSGQTMSSDLDLVLLTNGWRRYNWDDMRAGKMPVIRYEPDNFLTIYGKAGKDVMAKLEKDEPVTLLFRRKDSSTRFFSIKPDANGYITAPGMVFYDSAKVFYSFSKHKLLNSKLQFSPNTYSLAAYGNISYDPALLIRDQPVQQPGNKQAMFRYYAGNNAGDGTKTLEEVKVKSKRKSWEDDPLMAMDNKYTTGWFTSQVNSYGIDVLHDKRAEFGGSVYSYLASRVPGLVLGSNRGMIGDNRFFKRPAAQSMGSGIGVGDNRALYYNGDPVLIYIDEQPFERDQIENVQLNQVAYIKFIAKSAIVGGFSPVLSIYYKKGGDVKLPTDMGYVRVPGYSPVKEFYSPDYSEDNAKGVDARSTLYWQPYLFSNAANRTIPVSFYNNDFTTRFRIVLEGINADGKLIHIEKLVE